MFENKCKQTKKNNKKPNKNSQVVVMLDLNKPNVQKIIFDSLKRLQLLAWGTWDKYQQYPKEPKKIIKGGGMEDMQNNYGMFSKMYTLQRLLWIIELPFWI